ncbi:hypothetical protein CRE_10385 [Caenorhabditis remanei]|uniref:PUM-HD domain-containing protein n=1 Tax=Caenorhabditis remanei TaxID=31234 RepID=E3MQH4_CAERE|nr:hypothetical protein CRE_10385 [Caenorhabditis remanei]
MHVQYCLIHDAANLNFLIRIFPAYFSPFSAIFPPIFIIFFSFSAEKRIVTHFRTVDAPDTSGDPLRISHHPSINQAMEDRITTITAKNFARSDFHNASSFFSSPKSDINIPRKTPDTTIHPFFEESSPDLSFHLSGLGIDENNSRRMGTSTSSGQTESKYLKVNRLPSLPTWALDENLEIRSDLTLRKVVDEGLVLMFSMDKSGCHFLQSDYYGENTQNVFFTKCKNIFGNFFLQRVIEFSNHEEQEIIMRYIVSDISALCLDKSACRVEQTALETLDPIYGDVAIPRKNRLKAICTDQNANHVIQKIIKKMELSRWEFLITYLCKTEHDNLLNIGQDKYGCHVV